MLTEDYIMRMISQAIAVLMTALGLKRAGKLKEALQALDQSVETLLGLNAQLANQLDDQALLGLLTFLGKLDIERVGVLAQIYEEQADVYKLLGQVDASQYSARRSLRLYLEVALAGSGSLEIDNVNKVEGLRSSIPTTAMPLETRMALMDYFDRLIASNDEFLKDAKLSRDDLKASAVGLDIHDF